MLSKKKREEFEEFWQNSYPAMFSVDCNYDANHNVPESKPRNSGSCAGDCPILDFDFIFRED